MLKALLRKTLKLGGLWIWRLLWRMPLKWIIQNERKRSLGQIAIFPIRARSFLIINYHRVHPEAGNRLMIDAVSPSFFQKQIEFLANEFNIISLSELADRYKTDDIPPNCVCLTFDDGYRDNYLYAFPILRKYNLPAAIFLVTGAISKENQFWFDRVFTFLDNTPLTQIRYAINGHQRIWNLKLLSEKMNMAEWILSQLKRMDINRRSKEINRLEKALKIKNLQPEDREILNWDEVKEMAEKNIEFGPHTHTHTILSVLSEKDAQYEIEYSKTVLKNKLGTSLSWFAYPNGRLHDFNNAHKTILRNNGFLGAFTTIWGINTKKTDRFSLARVPGNAPSLDDFRTTLLQVKFGRV